jgi:hypothetical protein
VLKLSDFSTAVLSGVKVQMDAEHWILEAVKGEISASGTCSKAVVKPVGVYACCSIIQESATTFGQG